LFLAFHSSQSIKNPIFYGLVISTVLMASSLFFMIRWIIHRYEYREVYGYIGSPQLMIGLIFVVLGSALLLWRAIVIYRQTVHRKLETAS
jgi:hypothetical protein